MALPMVLAVGVVAENENIETSLSRKGMYGIDEGEMLRGFETAMMQPKPLEPASLLLSATLKSFWALNLLVSPQPWFQRMSLMPIGTTMLA